jgi:hypothetical protein
MLLKLVSHIKTGKQTGKCENEVVRWILGAKREEVRGS